MAYDNSERSFPRLFTDAIAEFTKLFQTEMRLARAEIGDKVSAATSALIVIVAGAVLLMAALVIFLQAVVAALVAMGLAPHWAALIVAVVTAAVGGLLAYKGVSSLRPENLKPDRTIHQLQRDVEVAREQVR